MNQRLKDLYKSVILKHNNEPFQFEKNENATHQLDAYNQLCGDRFNLFFEIENGVIQNFTFHGFGCAISKASTSVLVKNLEGKTIEEALSLCEIFQKEVQPDLVAEGNASEEFEAFSAAKDFPGRLKCATLSWDEIIKFLKKK